MVVSRVYGCSDISMLWHFFSKALILLEFAIRGNFQEFQGVKKFLQKYRYIRATFLEGQKLMT